jgi:hypothetical protein
MADTSIVVIATVGTVSALGKPLLSTLQSNEDHKVQRRQP